MKYYVHIYATCRTKVPVEAESQQEAVKKANQLDMNALFDHNIGSSNEVEFAEEVQDFLVDEEGDTIYEQSKLWKLDENDEPVLSYDYQPVLTK